MSQRSPTRLAAPLGRAWTSTRRFMTRALGPVPLTPLGLIVIAGSGHALVNYGLARIDLILLVVGAVGLALACSGLLATLVGRDQRLVEEEEVAAGEAARGDERGELGARSRRPEGAA